MRGGDDAGRASSVLSTVGPPLRGTLWEATAVPEIRQQAHALARTWLRDLMDWKWAAESSAANDRGERLAQAGHS